jgi:hypothetical protein
MGLTTLRASAIAGAGVWTTREQTRFSSANEEEDGSSLPAMREEGN